MLENLEKMAKELGYQNQEMISVALENYKKGQENKKRATAMALKQNISWLIIPYGKRKARYFTFLLYPDSIPEDWEMKLSYWGFRWQSVRYMIRI